MAVYRSIQLFQITTGWSNKKIPGIQDVAEYSECENRLTKDDGTTYM